MRPPVEVHTSSFGHSRVDFNRTLVRRELRRVGQMVSKDARGYVNRRRASGPSEFPGRRTGALFRAIKARVSRSGFSVAVAPFRTAELMRKGSDAYYPGYLLSGAARDRGGRLHPRDNYIEAAAIRHQAGARARLGAVLQAALVPRG